MPGVALGLVLLLLRLRAPGAEMILVTTGLDETINIRQATGSPSFAECQICVVEEGEIGCHLEYWLPPKVSLLVNFTCMDPQHTFTMEVKKDIGEDHNLEDLVPRDLPRLNTTYTWAVNVPYKVGVAIDFSENPVRQTDVSHCPDLVQYKVIGHVHHDNTSEVPVGTFCRNGTISNVKIQGRTLIVQEVPWTEVSEDSGFQLSFVPPIKLFSVVTAVLRPGSPAHFMSANWPRGFPNDELMSWLVVVPADHHANMTVENFTKPSCVKRAAGWFFGPSVLGKTATQFRKMFVVTLQNCDMDYTQTGQLTLSFHAQAFNNYRESFAIDLRRTPGVSVRLRQLLTNSSGRSCICRTPFSTDCASELLLGPGDHLNVSIHFQCDPEQDIAAELTTNISCLGLPECSVSGLDLVPPQTLSAWPLAQRVFVWVLETPPELTIELSTKQQKLQQMVPGERCGGDVSYSVSTMSGLGPHSLLGHFCPGGAVELIQMADSMRLELLTGNNWSGNVDIRLTLVPRVTEDYIMKVTPEDGTPVHLLTPNWGEGMASKLTASWDISVPAERVVKLTFLNHSLPVCQHGHVFISVDEQKDDSTVISFRETDSLPTHPLPLAHRFWLNVSNCELDHGQLDLMVHLLVAEPEVEMDVLVIVAAVAGGLVLVIIIALVVCCIKHRQRQAPRSGLAVHNEGRGRRFGKKRQDNESHIYAVIDEDRVYAAQFHKATLVSIPEVDMYRPFQGPMGVLPPPRGPHPEALPMVTNELYSFAVKKQDPGTIGEMATFLGSNSTPSS